MMSLSVTFGTTGGAIGAAVGGALLVLFVSYQAVGLALGATDIAAATIFCFLTKDPTKIQTQL
jgi:hypothetical protein